MGSALNVARNVALAAQLQTSNSWPVQLELRIKVGFVKSPRDLSSQEVLSPGEATLLHGVKET